MKKNTNHYTNKSTTSTPVLKIVLEIDENSFMKFNNSKVFA